MLARCAPEAAAPPRWMDGCIPSMWCRRRRHEHRNQPPRGPKLQAYVEAWGASIGGVIQQVAGAAHTWQELSPKTPRELLASLKENGVSIQFDASQHLAGNQGFVLSAKDAVRLSQLLLSEPENGSATMGDDHRDAIGELFRQFAGAAASSLKSLAGGEVSFKWVGLDPFPEPLARKPAFSGPARAYTPLTLVAELGSIWWRP